MSTNIIVFGDVLWAIAQEVRDMLTQAGVEITPVAGSTDHELGPGVVKFVGTGGQHNQVAIAKPSLDVDVYSDTEGGAEELAQAVHGAMTALGLSGMNRPPVVLTHVSVMAYPYINPDPRNPRLHRATGKYQVVAKGHHLSVQ